MSIKICDRETHRNTSASDRNDNDLTILDSEGWSTESPEQGMESINKDGSQKYLVQTSNSSSEEQILDSVFQVCDVEERGVVPAFQIIDYLKTVTDPNRDGKRLQCLKEMLDPDGGRSTLVDLMTFRKAMSKWIESCWMERNITDPHEDEVFIKDLQPSNEIQGTSQLDGYGGGEHRDLSIKIAELDCTNKKLTDEKTKLQRSLDVAEETNTLLTEEISDLKNKLKSSQQAMQHTRSICNELEDTRILAKNLEDQIGAVITEKKQLEKEDIFLSIQNQSLQDENYKLLSENKRVNEKLDSLRIENTKLKHQLYEYENLLLQKDELLSQRMIQSEELNGLVEEQKTLLQELRQEKNDLQEKLLQTHEDMVIHSSLVHNPRSSDMSVFSVRNEIEEIQEANSDPKLGPHDSLYHLPLSVGIEIIEGDIWRDIETEYNLNTKLRILDPLYHISDSSEEMQMIDEDIWGDTETKIIHLKQGANMLLNNLHIITSSEQQATYLEEQSILLKGISCLTHLKCAWETYASKLNGAKPINTNKLSLSQRTRLPITRPLLHVNNHLAVHHRQQQRGQYATGARDDVTWLLTEGVRLPAPFMTKLKSCISTRRFLLMLFFFSLMISIWSGENIWTVVSATLWPHLELQHLNLPPI
ncbi:protein KASH5 isoform X2 [Engystomops pustulosus]|uniref:protein KASH5 isoform X2 n=1 Tax=Engystomops pustulosus TaxID=76066 RepID=UPI003AFB0959